MLREGSAEDLFKKVPHLSVEIHTECGSKSIKIDFSTMSMEISVDLSKCNIKLCQALCGSLDGGALRYKLCILCTIFTLTIMR